jgi:hypothetical protein
MFKTCLELVSYRGSFRDGFYCRKRRRTRGEGRRLRPEQRCVSIDLVTVSRRVTRNGQVTSHRSRRVFVLASSHLAARSIVALMSIRMPWLFITRLQSEDG